MRTVREQNAEEVERERDERNPQCDAVSSVPIWPHNCETNNQW